MIRKKNNKSKKITELKKSELDHILLILDLHSEAIEDGNTIFDDIIKRLERLETGV